MKTIESIFDLLPLVLTISILWLWASANLLINESKQFRPNYYWITFIIVFGIVPPVILFLTLIIFYISI